jgi:hypothetical protein
MKLFFMMILLSIISISSTAQVVGDYRSNGGVNFNSATNWQVLTGLPSTWTNAAVAPVSASLGNTNTVTILAAHTLTINSAVIFGSNTNFTVLIQGSVSSAANYVVSYGSGQSTVRIERNANYSPGNIFQNHQFKNLVLVGTSGTPTFTFAPLLSIATSLTTISSNISIPSFTVNNSSLTINADGNVTVTGVQTITNGSITATFSGNNRQILFSGSSLTMSNGSISATFPNNISPNQGRMQVSGQIDLSSGSAINLSGNYAELTFSGSQTALDNSAINLFGANQKFHITSNQTVSFQNNANIKLLAANGLLDLAGTVGFSGTSATSYIQLGSTSSVSTLIKQNNNFTYPIGTASNYLPITVKPSNGGGNQTFTVGVFTGATTNAQPGGTATYKPPVVDAIWNVQTTGTINATLGFGWQTGLEGSVFNGLANNQMGVGQYNTSTSSWNPAVAGSASNNAANTFSTVSTTTLTAGVTNAFAIGQIGVSLPLLSRNFTAAPYNEQVRLNWIGVATNISAHFEVERNATGNDKFVKIASIPVTTTGEANYQYIDASPSKPESHYRIKIIDENRNITYTKTLKVNLGGAHFLLDNVYPTISTSQLNLLISSSRQQQIRIDIIDLAGRTAAVRDMNVNPGSNTYTLDVSGIAKGSYLLLLSNGKDVTTTRFIKQ